MLFYSDTMAYGKKDERKLIISVWHQVFRTGYTSPTVFATQTSLHLVDTEISQISFIHLLQCPCSLLQPSSKDSMV